MKAARVKPGLPSLSEQQSEGQVVVEAWSRRVGPHPLDIQRVETKIRHPNGRCAMADFPIFDLSRFEHAGPVARAALGAEVDEICRTTGFLAISGHSVPEQTIATAWSAARSFFDLSSEEKNKARAPYAGYPYGYLGPGVEALAKSKGADTPPDLKESFNGGPLSVPPGLRDPEALAFCYAETIWPSAPIGFVDAWKAYYAAMENLAARIMRVFAVALKLRKTISPT